MDQQLYSGNLLLSLVDCGRVGPLIVVAQKRQPELRVPSAGRFYVKSPGVVGVKWVTVSASITGKSLLRFVARSYVFGLCRACFICSNPDSDGNYGTARKFGGRLVTGTLSFATAVAPGYFVVTFKVMRNASLPSASTLLPVVLRGIWF